MRKKPRNVALSNSIERSEVLGILPSWSLMPKLASLRPPTYLQRFDVGFTRNENHSNTAPIKRHKKGVIPGHYEPGKP